MSLNIPVLAMSVVGVLLVAAGLFNTGGNFILVLFGFLAILMAWILQEGTKRRT